MIGLKETYDIQYMTVSRCPLNGLYIKIYSNYLHTKGNLPDLFISLGRWKPDPTEKNYALNCFKTGEDWKYALVLDQTGKTQVNLLFYIIKGSFTVDDNETCMKYNNGIITLKQGQEISFVPGKDKAHVAAGFWFIGGLDTKDLSDDYLSLSIYYDEFDCKPLEFHYASDLKSNDIIEGCIRNECKKGGYYTKKKSKFRYHGYTPFIPEEIIVTEDGPENPKDPNPPAPVPEPATIFLIGIGMTGLIAIKRKGK